MSGLPPPTRLVEEIASTLPPGRALDLACGAGRNALWLAERGWHVTAVDLSPGPFEHPRVTRIIADLEAHQFTIAPGSWNLIVMSYYLQPDLFPHAIRGLAPGGTAIVIVHRYEPGHEQSRFSLHDGELANFFQDCEILHSYEGPSRDAGHTRAVAEIAVRP